MKLLRYGNPGEEKPGILDYQGNIRDISAYIHDLNSRTLGHLPTLNQLKTLDLTQLPLIDKATRIGACIDMFGKILCVGFNSRLHAKEMGVMPLVGSEMLVFMKPNSSVCGPFDPILHTRHTKKLDWEAELAIVIGKQGKYISEADASDYILGYACFNDLSERYLQLETADKQFTKAKGFDNAAPLGPYLVTKDEIVDSSNLEIKLWVNDELRQDFNTGDYIHNDIQVISYLSQYFTLYPGDIISMGSAPGSAKSWGEAFLKPGDRVTMAIVGLGQQEQQVIIEPI
ncbi:fumarylacetoacetate hydrolase family protein [bacterium]|nr:fumarylacetoacetate hydrolase family protein [bacterium]